MKRDLYFSKPLMNAAGFLGFSPDPRMGLNLDSFGAFVTNPVSLRPRLPASEPALIEYPGGFLLHTGLPNPGLSAVIKKFSSRWERSDLPIIVHLMADRPEETKQMVQMLESIENIMAVELGFAPLPADDILLITLEMCLGELPLIFSLPHDQVLSVGPKLIQNGTDAISISPPRGTLANRRSPLVSGRLYGASIFPKSLETVVHASKLGLPVVGAGGVWTEKDLAEMLSAGAMAVQTDASLWIPREALNGTRANAGEHGKG